MVGVLCMVNVMAQAQISTDSLRIRELDQYWNELTRTVKAGDFDGYSELYHPDAIIVMAAGKNPAAVPIAKALASWEQGFNDTKAGKIQADVEFRFAERIGSATAAYEKGMFRYSSIDAQGKKDDVIVKFESLLTKRDNEWIMMMEYHISLVDEAEWQKLLVE